MTTAKLTDHGSGIRTINVGPIQITHAIALQLDTCEIWSNSPQGFTPLAKINTGRTLQRDRIKPKYRNHNPNDIPDHKLYQLYNTPIHTEYIGHYENENELCIWQIAYGDLSDQHLNAAIGDKTQHTPILKAIATWTTTPTAVLP